MTENILNTLGKETEVEVEVAEETQLQHDATEANEQELNAKNPDDTSIKFRNQLDEEDLAAVKEASPKLASRMTKDYSFIIDFGQEVMEELDSVSNRMLEEQKKIEIPEADQAVNGILKELDGYSAKYSDPKLKNLFSKIAEKFRGSTYTLKNMVRDAKPISDKLDIAKSEIFKMELKLQDNVRRGHELRKTTMKTVDNMVRVLAIFEEVIEISRAKAVEMENKLNMAEASGEDAVIVWEDKKYTIEEFREVLQNQVSALGEMEKTWFAWRQKFFMYNANITASRNIINTSIGLLRTCHRVRTDAIPAAKHQITVWQQAELAHQGAQMAERANAGVDRLVSGASKGMADAVEASAEANQRAMLSEDTITQMTQDLQRQFKAIVDSEQKGRAMRSRNLEVMEASEKTIAAASEEARKQLLANAMEVVRQNSRESNQNDTDNVLGNLMK